jgi:predicted Zn-dependent protease
MIRCPPPWIFPALLATGFTRAQLPSEAPHDPPPLPPPPRLELEPEIETLAPGATFSQRRRLAFRWLGEGRPEASIPVFEALLGEQPADKATRLGLGSACIETADYARAEKLYQELLAEFPSDYPILNNLAWLYATARDPKFRDGVRSAQLAQQALLLAPGDYHVWSTLAEAYYVQGLYERAERAAREALTLANRFQATEKVRLEYVQQVDRCKRAAQAMKILE